VTLDESTRGDPLAPGDAGGKVIRGGGLRAAAHVAGVVGAAVSAPLVIRHLGVEGYGKLAVVGSILFVATALTEGGLANVAVRQYAVGGPADRRELIGALLGLRVVLTAISAAGAIAFGLAAGYDGVVMGGIALACVAMLANSQWGAFHTALVAQLRLSAVAALEIVRALATTALFVALVVAGADLGGFYAVAPTVAFILLVAAAALVRRDVPLLPRLDLPRWRALLRETALYAAATALGAIYFQVALVTTSLLTSEHETGLYAIAFRIVELANGVPWLLAGSVFPVLAYAAAHDEHRLRYATGRVTEAALIAGGTFAVAIALGARFGIDVVAGEEGRESVRVLQIMAASVMGTFLVAAWGFVLLSRERYRALVVANAAAFGLAVVASVVLVPELGADGAAGVTVVLELALAGMYGVAIARDLPGLRPGVALLPRLALALAAAFAVGVPLLLLVHPLPAVVAGVAVYAAVLHALRAIPPELFEAVPRRDS
jgi:O-antigen/teichoic acid export membrane protein